MELKPSRSLISCTDRLVVDSWAMAFSHKACRRTSLGVLPVCFLKTVEKSYFILSNKADDTEIPSLLKYGTDMTALAKENNVESIELSDEE